MLVLCYGMQGSASSWVFRAAETVLEKNGFSQKQAWAEVAPDISHPWGGLEGAVQWTRASRYLDAVQVTQRLGNNHLVYKTHSDLPKELISHLNSGDIRAIVTTRNIFECAASLLRKAENPDASGHKHFAHIKDIDQALTITGRDFRIAQGWLGAPKTLNLPFQVIQQHPGTALRLIGDFLEMSVDGVDPNKKPKNYQGVGTPLGLPESKIQRTWRSLAER